MAEIRFDETIEVLSIEDKQNKRVYRIVAKSENGEFYLELDVHTSLYSMLSGEKYKTGKQDSLADAFEFVMHGLLYRMPKAAILKWWYTFLLEDSS
ncbi:DNA-directed RNA polymerases II, IV and V subunit 8B-like [Primulina eburnea]|uniref:DNA-directed RNA polymerases II, IV and V subunit 8B-like n=1 Tax=Primulina eburnea TaxID=1245227 RepID=UPI003C6C84EE